MNDRVTYTPELLAELAAHSASVDEMLLRLGKTPDRYNRKYLRKRLRAHGIDTGHHPTPGTKYTREVLAEAVAACTTFAGVARYLTGDKQGGTHSHLSRQIRRFGIDTSHFTGQAHARGSKRPRKDPSVWLVRLEPDRSRVPGQRLRQALVEIGRPDRCAECGTGPIWRGHPMTLEVDHINGDWRDNRAENLRLLCPNCHAVTPTYCGRNKQKKVIGC